MSRLTTATRTAQAQKSHKQDILGKHLYIDQLISLCVLWDEYHKLFCVFGDFYASGTQHIEITKSLKDVTFFFLCGK